jgi:L-asparaginase II
MTIFTEHNGVNPVVAEVVRSGFAESRHHGAVAGLDATGTQVISVGQTGVPFFPRSANKPLQAVAMLRCGLDLDGELLALAAASHSGEDFHVAGVRKILSGAGLSEDDLGCPAAWPLDTEIAAQLITRGEGISRIRMNCSGKHAAMLATCVRNGWPVTGYLAPDHPLQQAILRTVEELAGQQVSDTGVDGCGAPLFALTLAGLARAFRALVLSAAGTPERKVADAMRAHPEWTSGTTRDERRLMDAVPGRRGVRVRGRQVRGRQDRRRVGTGPDAGHGGRAAPARSRRPRRARDHPAGRRRCRGGGRPRRHIRGPGTRI